MANEYIQVEELKATLELTGETFADSDIETAITAASRVIDELTDQRFYTLSSSESRCYSPRSHATVTIDAVSAITTVKTDDNGDGTFEQTWTLNTDYVLEPLNASVQGKPWTIIRRHPLSSRYFPSYPRSLEIVGSFGWAAVPAPIVQAVTIVANQLLLRARQAPFGIVAIGVEQSEAMRIGRFDPDVQRLLAPYMRLAA